MLFAGVELWPEVIPISIPPVSIAAVVRARVTAACALLAIAPGTAFARLIGSSSDPALVGALVETFDSYAPAYFNSQSFLIGTDGFTVTPLADELHVDNTYCASFGTGGSCLDTLSNGSGANDDFDVVFTGAGVSVFGFDLTALDTDWTIETYDTNDNLLGSYLIVSQSPGLTDFDRRGYFGATEALPIQYFTARSGGTDRALIDNFAYTPVPRAECGGAGRTRLDRAGDGWSAVLTRDLH